MAEGVCLSGPNTLVNFRIGPTISGGGVGGGRAHRPVIRILIRSARNEMSGALTNGDSNNSRGWEGGCHLIQMKHFLNIILFFFLSYEHISNNLKKVKTGTMIDILTGEHYRSPEYIHQTAHSCLPCLSWCLVTFIMLQLSSCESLGPPTLILLNSSALKYSSPFN